MADKDIREGDKVQWNYGAGQPKGFAAEIKSQPGEKVQIETKKGNIVSRNADEDNPAVRVERGGEGNNADVVKRMSELEKVADYGEHDAEKGADATDAKSREGKEPVVGDKRARESSQLERDPDDAGLKEDTAAGVAPAQQQPTGQDQKPKTKKAKISREAKAKSKGKTKVEKPATAKTSETPRATGRGRGRGRAKAVTTCSTKNSGRRSSMRAKERSVTSQESLADASEGISTPAEEDAVAKEIEMAGSEVSGEEEEEEGAHIPVGETPAGHTRSKD